MAESPAAEDSAGASVTSAAAPFRVIDLFAGCGGLTTGFAASGLFRPVAAVEHDVDAAATYAVNFGEHVHVGDIRDWGTGRVPFAEVVVGGPPCQGFSALGRKDPDDPRNALWREYLRIVARVRPAFFVIENVPPFLRSDQFAMLRAETAEGGLLSGYRLESHLVNATDFGVPQRRKRAVVIGRPQGMGELGSPVPTGATATLADALSDLPPVVTDIDLPSRRMVVNDWDVAGPFSSAELHVTREVSDVWRRRVEAIPPGGNRLDLPVELQLDCWKNYRGAADVMGRLSWHKPSVTIRTEFFKPEKGRYLHPDQHRALTHLEAARLQGFPDSFMWCGSKASIARQIGNAVPPLLAEALARHVGSHLS
nr:DNA cytosine methyltransferase [Kineococcus vitellinus]